MVDNSIPLVINNRVNLNFADTCGAISKVNIWTNCSWSLLVNPGPIRAPRGSLKYHSGDEDLADYDDSKPEPGLMNVDLALDLSWPDCLSGAMVEFGARREDSTVDGVVW